MIATDQSSLSFEYARRPGDTRVRQCKDRQHHIARPRLDGSKEFVGGRLDPGVDRIERTQGWFGGPGPHRLAGVVVLQVDHRRRLCQQRVQVGRRARGDDHGQDHTRQCGMQSGLVKKEPEDDAADRVRQSGVNAGSVEYNQQRGHYTGGYQITHVDRASVKQRDNCNRHDVVDDDCRSQEYAQLDRDAVAKEHN